MYTSSRGENVVVVINIDIASNFDSFVRGKYPDDTQLQVEACYLKLRALYLYFMFERLTLTAEQKRKREVGVTANEILSLIYQMKGGLSLQPMRYIAINEGTEESARRAVAYFEKCLAVNKKIGNGQGVVQYPCMKVETIMRSC